MSLRAASGVLSRFSLVHAGGLILAVLACGRASSVPASPVTGSPAASAPRAATPLGPVVTAPSSAPVVAASTAPPPAPPSPWPPPAPPWPTDGRQLFDAPERLDHLIIKISFPVEKQCRNVRYEGHNGLVMKGSADGAEAAQRWRSLVAGTRGVFVLRDSIWSQQDHPYLKIPYALMMPPSWVTAAMDDVAKGRAIVAPVAPAAADDAAWAAIKTPEQLFGSFPSSDSLHREAIRAIGEDLDQALRTKAARASMASLRADVEAMKAAAAEGVAAVAAAGAVRIAMSDAKYFGASLRHHRVIPIFVENPNNKELKLEGKGMIPLGRPRPADALVTQARDAVYRRRLQAGDLAVERYDLSVASERKRAIALLEALIPKTGGEKGGTLWLWVTGRLDPLRKAQGENALKYLSQFRKELATAKIDHSRLRLVSKPAADLPTDATRKSVFDKDVRYFRRRDLPYAVRMSAHELHALLTSP